MNQTTERPGLWPGTGPRPIPVTVDGCLAKGSFWKGSPAGRKLRKREIITENNKNNQAGKRLGL